MEPPLSVCRRLFRRENEDHVVDVWKVLSEHHRSELRDHGFTIVDGMATPHVAGLAHDEALKRASVGKLAMAHPGGDVGVTKVVYEPSVRDDVTMFISPAQEKALLEAADGTDMDGVVIGVDTQVLAIHHILGLLRNLGDDLGRLVRLTGGVEYQLAVYPTGVGARYKRHRDAFPDDGWESNTTQDDDIFGEDGDQGKAISLEGVATEMCLDSETIEVGVEKRKLEAQVTGFRRVTAVLYLAREGEWDEEDGGALRLYPPVKEELRERCSKGGEQDEAGIVGVDDFVDIMPIGGRAVLFLSGAVDHEVRPVTGNRERAALTAWYH
ncbi:unnamed protein product [Choristocarpus tenellus]